MAIITSKIAYFNDFYPNFEFVLLLHYEPLTLLTTISLNSGYITLNLD